MNMHLISLFHFNFCCNFLESVCASPVKFPNSPFIIHQYLLSVCRSKIRIRDGRAKPIDLLAKYISAEDDDLAVEMHEPYTFLNGLTVTDMEDLLEDIKVGRVFFTLDETYVKLI